MFSCSIFEAIYFIDVNGNDSFTYFKQNLYRQHLSVIFGRSMFWRKEFSGLAVSCGRVLASVKCDFYSYRLVGTC